MAITITATPIQNGIEVTGGSTTITAAGVALANTSADSMGINAISGLSATNVQGAIEELAGNAFQQDNTPTGSQVNEGDTWYDTDDNQYKIYRETSNGVYQWVPIIVGSAEDDSDTLDAGAF
jgi:protein involved in temperature-dependent protein secretion